MRRTGPWVSLECPIVCGWRETPFQRELSPSKLRRREVVAVFYQQAKTAFFDRSFCLPPLRTFSRGITVRPSPLVQAQRGGRARRVGPIPDDHADHPEVAARAQLFQSKPRPGRQPSARRPMSRRHSFRGRQRDCTGAPVNRSSSKYLVGVGEHEPNPIDGHDDYDSRKYEFCETILRHRTNSENKAAERK